MVRGVDVTLTGSGVTAICLSYLPPTCLCVLSGEVASG